MSLSVHANNRSKNILISGKGQTQGVDNITLTEQAEYFINFSRWQRKYSLL